MAQRSRTVAERFADASALLSRIQFKYGVVGDEVDDELSELQRILTETSNVEM
jgi:hypothetical protein